MPFTLTANVHDALAFNVAPDKLTLPDPATAVIVPPHVPVCPAGVATCNPAGSVSLNAIPVSGSLTLVLLTAKLNDVVPFSGIVAAPNAWLTVGAAVTLKFAVAALPVPALADVTRLVVFVRSPGSVAFTFTLKVQDALGDKVAPDKLTLLDPETAVMLPPPHDPVRPLGVITTRPPGRPSVNPTPVSDRLLTWEIVKLRLVVAFTGIRLAPNDLLIEGGDSTVRLAVAVPPVPPSTDVTAPVKLFCAPAAVPLTFTLNVHESLTSSVAPVKLTLFAPAVAFIVPPPHDPVRP